jgi:hypothetical protein
MVCLYMISLTGDAGRKHLYVSSGNAFLMLSTTHERGDEPEHRQVCSEGARLLSHWLAPPSYHGRGWHQHWWDALFLDGPRKDWLLSSTCRAGLVFRYAGPPKRVRFQIQVAALKGCKRCGGTDHKRSSSKKCPHNKDRKLPPGE